MLRVKIEKIARHYAEQTDEELLRIGRGGNLTPEARLALKTELLKRGHSGLDWIDKAASVAVDGPERNGFGGWMFALCVFVGALYPALAAWGVQGVWALLQPTIFGGASANVPGYSPLVTGMLWAHLLCGVAVVCLGPLSVVLLRRNDARGPALARGVLYLVLLAAMTQLLTLGPTLGVDRARALLSEASWFYSLHAVVAGGWLIYLNHSRRVRTLQQGAPRS